MNCSAVSRSLPRSSVWIDWRSSRDLLVTRSSSPWIWDLTVFGPSSRMILAIFLAFSWSMPSLRAISRRYSLPESRGVAFSSLPVVEVLQRDLPLDQPGLEDVEDGLGALLGVGLDEDRVLAGERDRGADALEVVARRHLLGRGVEGVRDLLLVDLADDVERRVGHVLLTPGSSPDGDGARRFGAPLVACYPSMRVTAGCPSGQWEWTVNPSRKLRRFESFTCHHQHKQPLMR